MHRDRPPPRVLVVDGSEEVRQLLRDLLREEGFDVIDAGSLAGACSIMGKASFDLIVLDLILPDARGLELVQSVRRMQPRAAVVVVSSYAGCLEQSRLAGLGVGRVLGKPFKADALLASVRTLSGGPAIP